MNRNLNVADDKRDAKIEECRRLNRTAANVVRLLRKGLMEADAEGRKDLIAQPKLGEIERLLEPWRDDNSATH